MHSIPSHTGAIAHHAASISAIAMPASPSHIGPRPHASDRIDAAGADVVRVVAIWAAVPGDIDVIRGPSRVT